MFNASPSQVLFPMPFVATEAVLVTHTCHTVLATLVSIAVPNNVQRLRARLAALAYSKRPLPSRTPFLGFAMWPMSLDVPLLCWDAICVIERRAQTVHGRFHRCNVALPCRAFHLPLGNVMQHGQVERGCLPLARVDEGRITIEILAQAMQSCSRHCDSF